MEKPHAREHNCHIIAHFHELVDPNHSGAQRISQDGRIPITSLFQLPLSPFRTRLRFLYNGKDIRKSSLSCPLVSSRLAAGHRRQNSLPLDPGGTRVEGRSCLSDTKG